MQKSLKMYFYYNCFKSYQKAVRQESDRIRQKADYFIYPHDILINLKTLAKPYFIRVFIVLQYTFRHKKKCGRWLLLLFLLFSYFIRAFKDYIIITFLRNPTGNRQSF